MSETKYTVTRRRREDWCIALRLCTLQLLAPAVHELMRNAELIQNPRDDEIDEVLQRLDAVIPAG